MFLFHFLNIIYFLLYIFLNTVSNFDTVLKLQQSLFLFFFFCYFNIFYLEQSRLLLFFRLVFFPFTSLLISY